MFATLLSAVSWTPGVHTLGWCRAPVLRTASLLLSANSASMGGDEVQPVSLDGFFSFFNTLSAAFNRFDLDGDGTITTAEIGAVLRECGETPSDGGGEERAQHFPASSARQIEIHRRAHA